MLGSSQSKLSTDKVAYATKRPRAAKLSSSLLFCSVLALGRNSSVNVLLWILNSQVHNHPEVRGLLKGIIMGFGGKQALVRLHKLMPRSSLAYMCFFPFPIVD